MPSPKIAARSGWRLQLHGAPQLLDPRGQAVPLEGRTAALVAYVALEGGARRDQLAHLLWPDSDDPRRNLRQLLLRHKRLLDGTALIEGDAVLSLAAGVSLLAPAASAELLGALRFDDAPEFQAWLDTRRRSQHDAAVQSLLAEVNTAEAQGRLDDAVASAQQLLQLDGAAEAHHRLLMRLHYLRGDRAAGLAVYDQWARTLHTRFGLQPEPATLALANNLRDGANALAPSPRASAAGPPVTVLRPPRLIGREDTLRALHGAWSAGSAALLLGDAGLGKSRVLAELSQATAAVGAPGRPGDAGVPYATLARLLRRLAERHVPQLTPSQAAALSPLLPGSALDAAPAGASSGLALMQGLQTWLLQAHAQGLQAVVVDDLHFADDASIEAVQSLIGAESLAGLRWALAARPAEGSAAVDTLRSALGETQALVELPLPPLDTRQMTALVQSLGLLELDAATLGPQLARHSGGNPLYALETLKQGLVDGSLRAGTLPRPLGVGALLDRRLKQLSEPALALARVAAIAGVDFDITLAEAVTGRSAVALVEAWGELEAAQVLRDGAFAHDLVHDAVLRGVPQAIARRLHEQCATHLSARAVEPARLAVHWARAGLPAPAALAYTQAAGRARLSGRRAEEAALLAQAAQCHADAGQRQQQFDVLFDRAQALVQADFGAAADQAVQALRGLAQTDAEQLRARFAQVDLHGQRGEMAATVEQGLAALALARRLDDAEMVLRIACPVAGALCMLDRPGEGHALLLPLSGSAVQAASPELHQLYLGHWALVLDNLGRLREAAAAYEESARFAQAHGLAPDVVAAELNNLSVNHSRRGHTARAVDASERAARILRDNPDSKGQPLVGLLTLARHLSEYARYGQALQLFDEVLEPIAASGARMWAYSGRTWLGILWLRLGQPARALQLINTGDDGVPPGQHFSRRLLRAAVAQATGSGDALALVEQATAPYLLEDGQAWTTRIQAAPLMPAEEVLKVAPGWIARALREERDGTRLQALLALVTAASTLAQHDIATDAAQQALALMHEGVACEPMYRGQAWLLLADALHKAGHSGPAEATLRAGVQWVQQAALPNVPPQFLDSFLHRNPHNRALLAAGRQLLDDTGPAAQP